MFGWLKKCLLAASFVSSQECLAASAASIEQVIYLYSPKADVNGAFETDRANGALLTVASQRGMKLVLLNADEMLEPSEHISAGVERLKKTLKKFASEKPSIVIIATHGSLRQSKAGTDTSLSIFDEKSTIPYSELAKVIDPIPTIRAVLSNVCFGFSDALLRTGRSGKVVAACSKRGKEANEVSSRIMMQALGEAMIVGTVDLGQSLRQNAQKYAKKCEAQGNARFRERSAYSADPRGNLLASIPGDVSAITACPSRASDLPIFDGTKNARMSFGGKSSAVVDGIGAPVKFCRDPNPRAKNTHSFIPGISYDPFFIWKHRKEPSDTTIEGLVQGRGIHLKCEKNGSWKACEPSDT